MGEEGKESGGKESGCCVERNRGEGIRLLCGKEGRNQEKGALREGIRKREPKGGFRKKEIVGKEKQDTPHKSLWVLSCSYI